MRCGGGGLEGDDCGRGFDRDFGIDRLGTSRAGLRSRSGVDRLVAEPEGDIAAIAYRLVILRPVVNVMGRLVCGMAIRAFVRLGHGGHHGVYRQSQLTRRPGRTEMFLCCRCCQALFAHFFFPLHFYIILLYLRTL